MVCIMALVSDELYFFRELVIVGQILTLPDMKMLSSGLWRNKCLQNLTLVNWDLYGDVKIVEELLSGISKNTSLETLNLSNNSLKDAHLPGLDTILELNVSLKNLFLDNNKLESCDFMAGLSRNETLEALSLSGNPINPEATGELLAIVNTCSSLVYLNLAGIMFEGLTTLITAHLKTSKIQYLTAEI